MPEIATTNPQTPTFQPEPSWSAMLEVAALDPLSPYDGGCETVPSPSTV
jgi:hypothetical protein